MAYCTWAQIVEVFPEAGDIEADAGDQTIYTTKATSMVDNFLGPHTRTPVQQDSSGAYDPLLIHVAACFGAHLVAIRHFADAEELTVELYGDEPATLTRYGHMAMSFIRAIAKKLAVLDSDVTVPEVQVPLVETSFTTTDGAVYARFAGGMFKRSSGATYLFTVESTGGTVAGEDLTFTVTRDNDEELWASASPLAVNGTGWHSIEYGLQVRFVDNATTPAWTNAETFTITCESFEADAKSGGVKTVEVGLA